MASIDLNIVDRGVQGSSWTASGTGLTAENLDKVLEQKTDNSGALNSLPTPFARFFVAREAFRRAMEQHLDSHKEAGFAYSQLVSDILDVYEILFNLKFHENNTWKDGEKLELREWDSKECLKTLKQDMPILYNSIEAYYKSDIKEDKLYFLVYTQNGKDLLLATSSPMTGFVTPPDMDKSEVRTNGTTNYVFAGEQYKNLHIRRKSGGEYFRSIKLFEDRDADFKNYMYNVIFGQGGLSEDFKAINEYVRSFRNDVDIRNDWKSHLVNVTSDQKYNIEINGLFIKCSDEIDILSYFEDSLIQLPYRISQDNFKAVSYKNDLPDRNYDYLLPFKPEIMTLFEGSPIDSDIHINRNSVTVELRYGGKTYSKEYEEEPSRPGIGSIYNMGKAKNKFDLGIFPNILSTQDKENNYFKVLSIVADEDSDAPNLSVDQIALSFFKDGKLINELDPSDAKFGVLPAVVRSRQSKAQLEGGTKFYELFNTNFDAIEVSILGKTGLVIPKWRKAAPTSSTFTYAIDLGTSNTFISRCQNGGANRPEIFNMGEPAISYLHENPNSSQLSLNQQIENSFFEKAKSRIKTEFLPSYIDGELYKFPIRTAMCSEAGCANKPKLFDNSNIAFFYEKTMMNENQNVDTNIKWENKENLIRIFIRELLLIVKCDILQRGGDLDKTNIVWFRPLSFMGEIRTMYKNIWREEPNNILSIASAQVCCFSESEAPYYYFRKMNYIKDSDAVAVIDIGGGSTDFVYFADNKPLMANSIHFGCDVLWDNGQMEFENERKNGIYNKYKDTLRFDRTELEDLNESMIASKSAKTRDIINFWLSNASHCDIVKSLDKDFKPVFVYHLTSILFYMASMFKDNGLEAPKTVVFSGNGSKYIDGFVTSEENVLKSIIDLVFDKVFGGTNNIHLQLPSERKESTCFGGLYRDANAPDVPEKVYQGDLSCKYDTVGEISANFSTLKDMLNSKYEIMTSLYKDTLDLLKKARIVDNTADTMKYVSLAQQDMEKPLNTYFTSKIKQIYPSEVDMTDSVFFLPIVDRIFEMTKL